MTTDPKKNSGKSFILYQEYRENLKMLSQAQKGDLLDAIFDYQNDEKTTELDPIVKMAFTFIKSDLDRNKTKYQNIIERNKINGLKGGRPQKPKKPSGLFGNPKNPEKPKETLNDNDNDNDNEDKRKIEKEKTQIPQIPDFIDSELWNGFLEVRKKRKAVSTKLAFKLILNDLERFENQKIGNANEALKKSIERGWSGVFDPEQAFSKAANFKNKTQRNLEILQNTKLT